MLSGRRMVPQPVEVALRLTLLELCQGTTKRLKVTRRVAEGTSGAVREVEVSPKLHADSESTWADCMAVHA